MIIYIESFMSFMFWTTVLMIGVFIPILVLTGFYKTLKILLKIKA